jgi:penicillin-binding protein 2
VAELTAATVEELSQKADGIIARVEGIRQAVQANTGRDDIKVLEETEHHCVVEDVEPQVATFVRVNPESFAGMCILERSRRVYPNGSLAPHVVGLVDPLSSEKWKELRQAGRTWLLGMKYEDLAGSYKMDDRLGVWGMEREYEDLLRGERGYVTNRLKFGMLTVEKVSEQVPPAPGRDIYLTIREDFQRAANDALAQAALDPEMDFRQGALVIVDVRSGAILAAATYPTYELERYHRDYGVLSSDPSRPLLFRPLQAALPTGSIFKIVTALAALDSGAVDGSTRVQCTGRKVYRGRPFTCTGHHGSVGMARAIEKSCNIYFYEAGLAVGGEALTRWGERLGLGMPTGVDWHYENPGQVPEANGTFEVLNLSIGQGRLLCNPLQVAMAMSVVANGGRLYTPHFLDHVRNAAGEVTRTYEPEFTEVPIDPSHLALVRGSMESVITTGTARWAFLDPFRAAGKTGTAEVPEQGCNHAWFAGYAPAEDPRIAFAVVNERTSDGNHGGTHAAPIMTDALAPIWQEVEEM